MGWREGARVGDTEGAGVGMMIGATISDDDDEEDKEEGRAAVAS